MVVKFFRHIFPANWESPEKRLKVAAGPISIKVRERLIYCQIETIPLENSGMQAKAAPTSIDGSMSPDKRFLFSDFCPQLLRNQFVTILNIGVADHDVGIQSSVFQGLVFPDPQ